MRFDEFEATARAVWEEIPEEFRQGVDGLVIQAETYASDEHAGVYTLGECLTEDFPSQYGGPDTIRSAVVLYYGSFEEVAHEDEAFDWEEEIHDTIMHELKHHLEALATRDDLSDLDHAIEQNFRRIDGEPFDPLFFRAGEPLGERMYRVEYDVFLEVKTSDKAEHACDFEYDGDAFQVILPATSSDVTFVTVEGPIAPGEFVVVRVVKRGVLATLKAALRRRISVESAQTVAVQL